ncbi:MAG: S16 family serine protease [Candidatus Micrarchaeota archaeon]
MRNKTIALFALFIVAAFFLGYVSHAPQANGTAQFFYSTPPAIFAPASQPVRVVHLKLPAVDVEDKGALGDLTVEVAPGSGRLFLRFDENNPLVNPDTQSSLRTALDLVKKLTGNDLHDYDVFYGIETQSDVIGGQSAGAALTVATMAAVKGDSLRGDTLITGAVLGDGSLAPVGRILAKAQAVKEAGYSTLIVPKGEATQVISDEVCRQHRTETAIVSECTTQSKEVNVGEYVGLNVVEADNVLEAYSLMTA